jgi:hypothetical protein
VPCFSLLPFFYPSLAPLISLPLFLLPCLRYFLPSSLLSFPHFTLYVSLSPLLPSFLSPSFRHLISLFLSLYNRFSSYFPPSFSSFLSSFHFSASLAAATS